MPVREAVTDGENRVGMAVGGESGGRARPLSAFLPGGCPADLAAGSAVAGGRGRALQ